jgi:hypothetical protein
MPKMQANQNFQASASIISEADARHTFMVTHKRNFAVLRTARMFVGYNLPLSPAIFS